MRDIRIAAAQFEHRDGDKAYNLGRIRDLTRRAAAQGAEIVCFHECSVTAYTFLQTLSPRRPGRALAEVVPDGPQPVPLIDIARGNGRGGDGRPDRARARRPALQELCGGRPGGVHLQDSTSSTRSSARI